VGDVADEFEFIARELPQVREVFIEDDTLSVDEDRCQALAEELVRRGNRLPFTANARADVSFETLSALKSAGLRLLCVGFESASQTVLRAKHKGIQVAAAHRFRADARRARVLVHGCFMAGGPGETHETLAQTLQLAKELAPDTAQFFPLMVYPGTEAYDWAQQQGLLGSQDYRHWLTPEGHHATVVEGPELSAAELETWCHHARRSFYLRPSYMASKAWQIISQPAEARRIARAAGTLARHLVRPPSSRTGSDLEASS
jgi:radical SAM superfamily enzyme YgiQ (UPF0313 family)